MNIAILGRQPAFGVAELERLYGAQNVSWLSDQAALVNYGNLDVENLGGSQKTGKVVLELRGNWLAVSRKIAQHYTEKWKTSEQKITLGVSVYGTKTAPRDIQKTGLIIKQKLRQQSVSLRLIPNQEAALNTATSHHNKLGLSPHKVELLIVRAANGTVFVAESTGAQNISALSARDQARPRTDAFVGMLPPKLALMMINLALGEKVLSENKNTLLDPFCGTGTVLQEALLKHCEVFGSDLSEKMVEYSIENLDWLQQSHKTISAQQIGAVRQGDAMTFRWNEAAQLDAVVCETYLGQPFSAPPSPAKLTEMQGNCNHIISEFLKNIRAQIPAKTKLCIAVPAWRDNDGNFTHLPLIKNLGALGYAPISLTNVKNEQLLYYRENQVVAREILLLQPR